MSRCPPVCSARMARAWKARWLMSFLSVHFAVTVQGTRWPGTPSSGPSCIILIAEPMLVTGLSYDYHCRRMHWHPGVESRERALESGRRQCW